MLNYKRFTFNSRHSVFYCISKYYLCSAPYMGYVGFSCRNEYRHHQQGIGPFLYQGDGNIPETF
ncbi:hypothetical protein GT765_10880 [Bifidobacterium pseudocatenulatum]|nr:hypothetical protein [Bifidobacterium pseudocatenulatum]